ncbi:LacI family DNA-binding transcriptional regulator [Marseilla massiliensis]|jgi:DNA-binding LacI/PurR family transcriptional regulator|uniref:LacI family DNA-binding transcriptional regulator n=1 Tax=Marseilla massiliensis TaxID=1841864 RepID=A0A938WTE7_9BACT|nr:LacI family DNA-binding transcriptional regulator [Marseilla massiliensis]MBM6674311.1 LacI family DNA-binding transcriptional regulator [Marseilla massiliensis]
MPENRVPITMKDIAREFGVSVATVSRALKGSPRISEKRRNEIVAYAKAHDFSPNIMAESLRNNKTMKIIGVIIPQFTHYYFSSILSGIEDEALKYGYRLLVAQSDERYEREVETCNSFYENKVCGIIVSQSKNTSRYDHFISLMNKGLPLVFYDRICTGVDASRVVVDDYMGAYSAVEYMIGTGCRNIAFYGSSMTLEISKNRYNGWHDALLKHGINPNDCIRKICDNREDAERITPEVLNADNRPDAFFAINDDTAIGIMYTAKRMGLRVPEDISVCGFTNGQRAVACDPMLTTVEQNGYKVGREAADILIAKVEGRMPVDKVEKRVIRTRLIVRGTTK